MTPLFITGTGTGIGKTIVSSVVSNALRADYWKPVQAGYEEGTDSELVSQLFDSGQKCFPELYRLAMPASPHLAGRNENIHIDLQRIADEYTTIAKNNTSSDYLVIEGAGGILVPLNDREFVVDLIVKLRAKVIIVSRNYLGSINHSLLTAELCRSRNLDVLGWIFNDEYMFYQDEIASWSGYPVIGSIPKLDTISIGSLRHHSGRLKDNLLQILASK